MPCSLSSLQYIYLNNNSISEIDSRTFSGKPDLRRVELRDNSIRKVKPAAIAVQQPGRRDRSGRTMTRLEWEV